MNPTGSNYSYPDYTTAPPRDRLSKFVLPAVIVLVLLLIGGGYMLFFQGIASQTQTVEEQLTATPAPAREYMMMSGGNDTPVPTQPVIEVTPTITIEQPVLEPSSETTPSL